MKLLTIDFETHDPYIDRDAGAGWVYKLNNLPGCDFEILGAAIRTHDGKTAYLTDLGEIKDVAESHDGYICHNASYDIGCLLTFFPDAKDRIVFDTEVMSRLYDSSLPSHSLDALSQRYLKMRKDNFVLADAVWDKGLYPWLKKEITAKNKAEKAGETYEREHPGYSKLIKYSKKNMKKIQEVAPEAMAQYALADVEPTFKLFKFFQKNSNMKLALKYSMLTHICIDYRTRGVRIDLDKAREVSDKLVPVIAGKYQECYKIAGEEFNLQSPKEVPAVFDKLNIKYPKTPAGNPSITSPWMSKQNHPICKAIIEARKAKKIHKDFVEKIIEMQEWTCPQALPRGRFGRVHPELNLLRARTGRFSCSSPNLQQIPSRDPEYSSLCRSLFVPEEGDKWFSLDFSNQEGRLQVHYAHLLGCEGGSALKVEFDNNPNLDMHQKVADMASITRTEAKTINLGLSYGMGIDKLATSLGVKKPAAEFLRGKYNDLAPFLSDLNDKCKKAMAKKGYIKTLGGRHSHVDPPCQVDGELRTFEYKALNKLIQGSAADMTIECMINAHRAGLPVLFPVHDSLELSGTREQALLLKHIMETSVELSVPMIAEGNLDGGDSWADAK